MATWTLFCPKCHFSFVHSIIEVKEMADYFLPAKPGIAPEGGQFKCSNCGHVAFIIAVILSIRSISIRSIRLSFKLLHSGAVCRSTSTTRTYMPQRPQGSSVLSSKAKKLTFSARQGAACGTLRETKAVGLGLAALWVF
jgi:hypothetical protein